MCFLPQVKRFPGGSEVKASAWNAGDPGSIPGLGRSPGEGNMATHSSILALENPWTEKPGGIQCIGSQKNCTGLRDKKKKKLVWYICYK